MQPQDNPQSTNDLLAALADGELDLCDQPGALAQITQAAETDASIAKQIAQHQQLKRACATAMDRPEMKCPAELAAKLSAIGLASAEPTASPVATPAIGAPATSPVYAGPSVIGRIGQWAPAAIAAVLLVAATVMFMQSSGQGTTGEPASIFTVSQIEKFDSRHLDCAAKPDILKQHDQFGEVRDLEQVRGKLADYFKVSTDGMQLSLSNMGYQYQLTGVCGIPGSGAVHIVYQHDNNADRAISLWLSPDDGKLSKLEQGRLYVETGESPDHRIYIWRSGGMIYYLVGDSFEDCDKAVKALRQSV